MKQLMTKATGGAQASDNTDSNESQKPLSQQPVSQWKARVHTRLQKRGLSEGQAGRAVVAGTKRHCGPRQTIGFSGGATSHVHKDWTEHSNSIAQTSHNRSCPSHSPRVAIDTDYSKTNKQITPTTEHKSLSVIHWQRLLLLAAHPGSPTQLLFLFLLFIPPHDVSPKTNSPNIVFL